MDKQVYLYIVCFMLLLQACERREVFEYQYEKNPQYSSGYAEFWGSQYAHYGFDNHVLSLRAFTDSLTLTKDGYLTGFGQYLVLNDIFVSSSDTIFPAGTYEIADTIDVFKIAPGELYDDEGVKYDDIGAYIYFIEKNEYFSVRKYIVGGTMQISFTDSISRFDCDFILDDKSELKGRFETDELIIYDYSVVPKPDKQKVKLNQANPFVVKQFVNKQYYKGKSKYTSQ